MSQNSIYKPRANFFWPVLSVTAVFFLFGLYGLFGIHSRAFMNSLKKEFPVVLELSSGLETDRRNKIIEQLNDEPLVLEGSLEFVSREEGLKKLSEELGPELLSLGIPNPLSDIITFKLDGTRFDRGEIGTLENRFRDGMEGVQDVYYQADLLDQLILNFNRLSLILLGAGILMAILSLMLIFNAIRLSIYNNRFLIRNMELVGASWHFIRWPFLKRSLGHGFWSGVLSIATLAVVYLAVSMRFPELRQYLTLNSILLLSVGILVSSLLVNFSSTWLMVNRFLREYEGVFRV